MNSSIFFFAFFNFFFLFLIREEDFIKNQYIYIYIW
jgi:hypothetical protein